MNTLTIIGFTLVSLFYISTVEWSLHRFVMHKPLGNFTYAFKAHALVHHSIFKADHSYHLQNDGDKKKIPMAWWNGPLLILLGSIPPTIILALTSLSWYFLIEFVVLCTLYYGAYERLHWCMHLPKKRRLEMSSLFRKLNGHHLLHHRYMHKNFNVVLPLADLILGTLLLRSKVPFLQAQGPAVPNVQPRAA